jgi:hypothetical protein
MCQPHYRPDQLAQLREGCQAVDQGYERMLGEYLTVSLRTKPPVNMRGMASFAGSVP